MYFVPCYRFNYKELGYGSLQWNSTFEGILLWKQKSDSRRKKGYEFDSGDPPIVLVARSGPEAEIWCQHIQAAQLSPTLERIAVIRDELRNLTGSDPLDTGAAATQEMKRISPDDEIMGSTDAKGLELSLSCENLTSEFVATEEGPNVHVVVSVCTPPEAGWKRVGTTEVVEGFHLGVVVTMVEKLSSNPLVELPVCDPNNGKALPCRSAALSSGPRLIIRSRKHKPLDEHQAPMDSGLAVLNSVCDNLLSKRYSFLHTLGERMHVVEFMGESKLCFDFPIEYL
ncbi:unnamed protein product [Echinostoma caproni]|uniref:PH domain-containing protein n=1 Tax=Echinostoma caproni TaxID=27848 RepID=A0A183ANV7_9TREM|nr:unnamed protein product [Echinostoma caproni]